MLSPCLEKTLRRALALANARQHKNATLEHLLMALTDDEDARAVLEACEVDIALLRANLNEHLNQLSTLLETVVETKPSEGFQRTFQRAAIYVQSSGSEVTGAYVLLGLFLERESHAVFFLREQNVTRPDVLRYIEQGSSPPGV